MVRALNKSTCRKYSLITAKFNQLVCGKRTLVARMLASTSDHSSKVQLFPLAPGSYRQRSVVANTIKIMSKYV